MNTESFIEDFQSYTKNMADCQQQVADIWLDGVKQANQVFISYSRSLFDAQQESSRELLESTKAAFGKVQTDGLEAVLTEPTNYLPPREAMSNLMFANVWGAFTKAHDELEKVAKQATEDYVSAVENYAADGAKAAKRASAKATKRPAPAASKEKKVAA